MNLIINGKEKAFSEEIDTVSQFLRALDVNTRHVAVEINGRIVEPTLFSETKVRNRDRIEIVSFVGGGLGEKTCNCGSGV